MCCRRCAVRSARFAPAAAFAGGAHRNGHASARSGRISASRRQGCDVYPAMERVPRRRICLAGRGARSSDSGRLSTAVCRARDNSMEWHCTSGEVRHRRTSTTPAMFAPTGTRYHRCLTVRLAAMAVSVHLKSDGSFALEVGGTTLADWEKEKPAFPSPAASGPGLTWGRRIPCSGQVSHEVRVGGLRSMCSPMCALSDNAARHRAAGPCKCPLRRCSPRNRSASTQPAPQTRRMQSPAEVRMSQRLLVIIIITIIMVLGDYHIKAIMIMMASMTTNIFTSIVMKYGVHYHQAHWGHQSWSASSSSPY